MLARSIGVDDAIAFHEHFQDAIHAARRDALDGVLRQRLGELAGELRILRCDRGGHVICGSGRSRGRGGRLRRGGGRRRGGSGGRRRGAGGDCSHRGRAARSPGEASGRKTGEQGEPSRAGRRFEVVHAGTL
jgi:hypothetical protein